MIKALKAKLKDFGIIEPEETVMNIKFVDSFRKNKIQYKNYEIEYSDEHNSVWHKDITIAFADSLGTLQQVAYNNKCYNCYICYVVSKDVFYKID